MNNIVKVLGNEDKTGDTISKAFVELKKLEQKFLDKNDYFTIKGKTYIKKSGFRKLALILGISTQVISHNRIDKQNYFVHEFTIRATSKSGRYIECSSACSSNEREFNHLENDCIATAQTRASNRAIADLLSIGEIYEKNNNSSNNTSVNINQEKTNLNMYQSGITDKQKNYLTKLIREKLDSDEQLVYLENINELSMKEASELIKELS